MRKLVLALSLLGVLLAPVVAQEPSSPPTADAFHQSTAVFERCTWMYLSATFSDVDGDLWETRLIITGPHEDFGFTLGYDDHTGQMLVSSQSCSRKQNAFASDPQASLDCEYSDVDITATAMTPTWRLANGLPVGTYTVWGWALDNAGQSDYRLLGSFMSIAAERACGL